MAQLSLWWTLQSRIAAQRAPLQDQASQVRPSRSRMCVWLHRSRLHCLKFATFLPDRLLFCAYRSTNLSSQHVGHRRGESVAGEVACTTAKKTLGISRELLAGLIAPQQSALWHERLLLAEVDLVSELEAGNLFCINVESMIFDISDSKEVAFEEDAQILRFAFAVERMLQNIKECGRSLQEDFFDGMHRFSSVSSVRVSSSTFIPVALSLTWR